MLDYVLSVGARAWDVLTLGLEHLLAHTLRTSRPIHLELPACEKKQMLVVFKIYSKCMSYGIYVLDSHKSKNKHTYAGPKFRPTCLARWCASAQLLKRPCGGKFSEFFSGNSGSFHAQWHWTS